MVGWYVVFRDVVIMCLCCLVLLAAAVKKNTSINMIKKNIKKVYKQKEKIGKFAISCAITRDQRLDQRVDQ